MNSPTANIRFFSKIKLGLALGGGGARGVAHVGVLRAFEEKKVPIASLSGTSAGALVAALFAFGKNSKEIEQIIESITFFKISTLLPLKLGLATNNGIATLLEDQLGKVNIKDAKIPLAIVCTDLISGQRVVFTEGPLALLVQASTSFPGIYSPVSYKDMLLVDGALTENVPISGITTLGASFVVAVSLSDNEQHYQVPKGMMDVIGRCFDIVVDHVSIQSLRDATYVIKLDLSFINRFKVSHKERAIEMGYQKALELLNHSALYWWTKPFRDYLRHILNAIQRLVVSLLKKPKYQVPLFFSFGSLAKPNPEAEQKTSAPAALPADTQNTAQPSPDPAKPS